MLVTNLRAAEPRPRRIAVGEFDGVHLGHREVIRGNDTALTFEPHPLVVVHPEIAPKLLTSFEVKVELIEALGVQELVVISFDDKMATETPQEFIESILVDGLHATSVSVGSNFRFGHGASGDPGLLAADPRFSTRIVPLVEADGEVVSSSRIRTLIAAGEVEAARRLLGSPFRLRGRVVGGDKVGRTLGFPTANIVPDGRLSCPGHGVYAGFAGGRPAAINVGVRPTFETDRGLLVEAHLLDYDGDLYDQMLTIEFHARLRGEWRFESAEELVAQMHRDVDRTRELLGIV